MIACLELPNLAKETDEVLDELCASLAAATDCLRAAGHDVIATRLLDALTMWEAFKAEAQEQVADLTRERDAALAERDHARTQLGAIGRKAFWAAK